MNDAFVAEASVAVAWAVLSQATPGSAELFAEASAGRAFVVPALWPFEISNALLTLKRRGKISEEHWFRARQDLGLLKPIVDDDGMHLALTRISELADEHELTPYDATYLELAIRRGLPLASRDRALNRAAHRCGVRTLLWSEKMAG